jgi:enterochelin esterase-like enzyme
MNAQLPTPSTGSIKRLEKFASNYVEARNVDIWLPDGYSNQKQYAVLYMHDGQMLYDSTTTWNKQDWGIDEVLGRLMKEKKIRNCIVVGVWNSDKSRHIDYFPQKPFESLPAAKQHELYQLKRSASVPLFSGKIQSDNYLKFLVKELKPYIDSNFSTLKDQQNTFVAGSSMGGLISMYAICEYPAVFGGAACLSTHWPGIFTTINNPVPAAFLQYLKTHLPSPGSHKFYFDHGTATLDSMYKPFQLQADAIMLHKGYTARNWMSKEFIGEDHSEVSWRKRFNIPAFFLLGETHH